MRVVVVDAGIGNLGAIPNMLKRLGAQASITRDPAIVATADRLILPGVGAFDAAMRNLRELDLIEPLRERALGAKIPVLGVCLGMQLLFESSAEGTMPGLGWLSGRVVRFDFSTSGSNLPVPHMGWNYVDARRSDSLFAGFDALPRFYFAHSYHVVCDNPDDELGRTTYGYRFTSAIQRGNISGIQFHPEKSHRFGLKVFENFLDN